MDANPTATQATILGVDNLYMCYINMEWFNGGIFDASPIADGDTMKLYVIKGSSERSAALDLVYSANLVPVDVTNFGEVYA